MIFILLYKMKNKKGAMEMSVGTIVTIVLLMAILMLMIAIVMREFDKPEFNITQEECWNETQVFDDGDNFLCSDGSRGFINESKKDILKEIENCFYLPIREVCEQVEVENLTISVPECFEWANREDVSEGEYFKYGVPCVNLGLRDKIISKQDLTIDWLNENCEGINPEKCYLDKPCDYLEYECGENYFVEVLK